MAILPTGETWKFYYFAGMQRIALRTATSSTSTLVYFLGDHLGSTTRTVKPDGTNLGEDPDITLYKAWGETRYASGMISTDYQYTGQRNEVGIGLYYYNARWYDNTLGRFAQADTIVTGEVQGWDRYAYSNNNPLNYTDSTGHWPEYPLVSFMTGLVTKAISWAMNAYNTIVNAPAITEPRVSSPGSGDITPWLVSQLNASVESPFFCEIQDELSLSPEGFIDASANWVSLVRDGAIWDWKSDLFKSPAMIPGTEKVQMGEYQVNYQAMANIDYGYAGCSAGFDSVYLQAGAGMFQDENSRGPWYTFGDDPFDNYWIIFGCNLSTTTGGGIYPLTIGAFTGNLNTWVNNYGLPGEPIGSE
jgi:RHS repeat-associated protein